MLLEEYCSYILSREKSLDDFTIPGTRVKIVKEEMLTNMRKALRDKGDMDYDSLLINTLLCYVSKDQLGRNHKFDENMEAVLSNIRKRVESINSIRKREKRPLPFSYERVFDILVYYLRLITNILNCDKADKVHYDTAEISPEAVLLILNRKLTKDELDEEWEKKGWQVFSKEANPFYSSAVDNYIKFIVLATYIRYCEIRNN